MRIIATIARGQYVRGAGGRIGEVPVYFGDEEIGTGKIKIVDGDLIVEAEINEEAADRARDLINGVQARLDLRVRS